MTGSYGLTPYRLGLTGYLSACAIILCVSYKRKAEKSSNPPYSEIEYRPAPNAVVGGKNIVPIEETNTTPRPIASGAPMFRNFSLGAHTFKKTEHQFFRLGLIYIRTIHANLILNE